MSFPVRPLAILLLIVAVAVPLAVAQPPAEPTAADVKALKEKFQTERDQAIKAKFPADTLKRADELLKRAEAAAQDENFKAALRHLRDARWQLPYLPPGLPEHVTRVLGEPAPVTTGARVLIFPGAAALWPYVLVRWLKSSR